jgi:hypothetical protein
MRSSFGSMICFFPYHAPAVIAISHHLPLMLYPPPEHLLWLLRTLHAFAEGKCARRCGYQYQFEDTIYLLAREKSRLRLSLQREDK